MSNRRSAVSRLLAASLLLVGAAAPAADWTFAPEPAEYTTWPEHCRVQYSYIARGLNSYGNAYSLALIETWRTRVGARTFSVLHHYCAAIVYLQRLRLQSDPHERTILIAKALDDGAFTYTRADPQSIVYPASAVVMAQAQFENKEVDAAIATLRSAIAAQPMRIEPYGALATIYRKQGHAAEALDVLMHADDASEGKSAEVKYNMGLLQVELGKIGEAVESAKQAYALGYPLPGLRNQLKRLGRWETTTKDVERVRPQ